MSRYPEPILHEGHAGLPVLLSIPHAGRDYDPAILALSTQGQRCLETLEDPLVDRLAWRAMANGIAAVIQPVPRAVIDCNRGEDEVDPVAIAGISPSPVGPKARHGLGIIPSRTARHGRIWRRAIDRQEYLERLAQVHRPYHQLLSEQLQRLAAAHGLALLIDLHSMPPRPGGTPHLVLGDRHGTTAARWLTEAAARHLRASGHDVALNDPYAGGEIVGRHGRPASAIHAIQVEIDRRLYLQDDLRTPGPGFDHIASMIARLCSELGTVMKAQSLPDAAE